MLTRERTTVWPKRSGTFFSFLTEKGSGAQRPSWEARRKNITAGGMGRSPLIPPGCEEPARLWRDSSDRDSDPLTARSQPPVQDTGEKGTQRLPWRSSG